MMNKEKWEEAMSVLEGLTEEQKNFIIDAIEKGMPEKELLEKIDNVDEQQFAVFMRAIATQKEEALFNQELSPDELDNVVGGDDGKYNNCLQCWGRHIYAGGFPNCAATVEDGSWCGDNDACYSGSVVYSGMKGGCTFFSCVRAWK